MRLRKTYAAFFTFIYLVGVCFGMFSLQVHALPAGSGSELDFITPKNGSVISYDTNCFKVNLPSGTTEANVVLDGENIGKTDSEGVIALSEPLTLGDHTVCVSAIYDDGTGERITSAFTAAVIPQSYTMDFEEYSSLSDAQTSMTQSNISATLSGKVQGMHSNPVAYIYKDSVKNSLALKFNNEKTEEIPVSKSYGYFYSDVKSDGTKATHTSGVIFIEFDFYLKKYYSATYMSFNLYSSGGQTFTGGYSGVITNNSFIDSAGSSHTIDTGWHHFKAIIDLDSMKLSRSLDGVELESKNIAFPSASGHSNLSYYGISISMGKNSYWSIDNIKTGEYGIYSGAEEILFENSADSAADSDGYVNTTSDKPVSRDTTSIKLIVGKMLKAESVIPQNITLVAAGKTIPITNAEYDDSKNQITLQFENADGIKGNGDSYIKLSENIKYSTGTPIGIASVNRFELSPEGFLIKSVDFKKGASDLFASSQLKVGDKVKADITIQNVDIDDAKLTAVLVVKSGNKFLSVTPLSITATGGTPNYFTSVESPTLTTNENITASVIFVDNLKSAQYIDSFDLV